MKNTKTELANRAIDFLATVYDLIIVFFARVYDFAYTFIIFIGEYVKWITTMQPQKSTDFDKRNEEAIHIHY